ncbi:glycosyltransferase [Spirulina sp. 06S082]|uniref:glycosyltransferase n=1 Tax=Spirulina sp. 06S082 TaxID=3110248 RepID=UPI002B2016F5|nr:glycosyltransferase [Spirulina sp. 06S082]MEA5469470.1 glycosyltransferase [Spirulina sp. 06S082]
MLVQTPTDVQIIHLWFPNIFEFKGGIQVYSAFLLQALQELYPQKKYDVFLKHDTRSLPHIPYLDNTRFHFSGTVPLKFRTFNFAAQLAKYCLRQRPDLIIASHANFAILADQIKRFLGIPYWVIAHGTEVWDVKKPSLQKALQRADRILAVSNYTRDRLLAEQDLDPDRVSLLPNTFAADRFEIAPKSPSLLQKYHLTADQPVILTVARLDSSQKYKGYDEILQGLPRIREVIPNVHYLLVGKGDDRDRLENLIQSLNVQDCVTLTGFVPDEELCAHYNLCDVFAMPSQGEGFGIVYLEALACGKPVLGGNRDGAIDALCGGELGVLVDPEDSEAIAGSLIEILQHKTANPILDRPEMLRSRVIETYGFEQFKKTLTQFF